MSILPTHKSEFDKKLDDFFGLELDKFDLSVISNLPLVCHKSLLPYLAVSFDVSIDNLNEQDARELLANAFKIHYYKGTLYSLKTALKAYFGGSEVSEWPQYNGKPYYFKVNLEASKTSLDQNTLKHIDKIINDYKNVRSVLESVDIKLTSNAKEYNGAVMISGETIEVLPFIYKNIEVATTQNITIGVVMIETIEQTIKEAII